MSAAGEFLRLVTPADAWLTAVAIHPESAAVTGFGFRTETIQEAVAFISQHSDCNIYWSTNPVRQRLNTKPKKIDVIAMAYVHLDKDDPRPETLEQLRAGPLPPTTILFSGGGYQAFWRLQESIQINGNASELEAVNRSVIKHFAGDKSTWNLDRVMRVAGTTNWPTAAKLARGRVAVEARLIEHHAERVYGLDEFAAFGTIEPAPLFTEGAPKAAPNTRNGGSAGKTRSEDLLARVGRAVRAGKSDSEIHTEFDPHPHAADQADPPRAVQRAIDKARLDWATERRASAGKDDAPRAGPAEQSVIELRAGRIPRALREVREVLADHAEGLSLMVFGRSLVRPFIVRQRGFRGESVEALELSRVSVRALAANLDSVTQFARWSKPRKEGGAPSLIVCDCPTSIAQLFLETPEGWSSMPRVNRVCETPLLRNGELFAKRGYNAESGAWLHAPVNIQLRRPLNRETASACLQRIREWVSEFPFADRAESSDKETMSLDESVALCALLTAALRASLPSTPGFLIDKPCYGAGATTLAKLVHVILTGRMPAVMNVQGDEEEELRKQLDAAQLAGRACVVLDNVRDGATLSSTALAQLISEPTRLVRILGQSKDDEVSCSQMVLVTGVNCTVANDLVRRFLRCRLAATQERPQEHKFKRPNLIEEAQAQRAAILSDLFTITAAYLASVPDKDRVKVTALAGFQDWSRLCAEPLVWLGHRDPVPSSHSLESEDPVTAMLREVVTNWHAAFAARAVTARELTRGMSNNVSETPASQQARQRLQEIFAEKFPGRDGTPDSAKVGTWLRRIRGRLIGKQSIHRGEDSEHDKVGTWVLRSQP